MAHAVDVRAVEHEAVTGRALTARVPEPVPREDEAVFGQRPLADIDAAGGEIVVVVAGLLIVEPADEPHVDMRVAVELRVVPLAGIVPDLVAPEARLAAHGRRERGQLLLVEVAVRRNERADPILEPVAGRLRVVRVDGHPSPPSRSRGLSRHSASTTA